MVSAYLQARILALMNPVMISLQYDLRALNTAFLALRNTNEIHV